MRIALERPQNYTALQSAQAVAPPARVQPRIQSDTQIWRPSEDSVSRDVPSAGAVEVREQKSTNVGFKWPETLPLSLTETISERNQHYKSEAIRAYTDQMESLESWKFKPVESESTGISQFSFNPTVSSAVGGAIAGMGSVIDMRV